jgi:alpha-glucosidase
VRRLPHDSPIAVPSEPGSAARSTDVGYHVVVPAWSDGDGDGIGDLPGLIDHLGYLELLGVDALLLDAPSLPVGADDETGMTRAATDVGLHLASVRQDALALADVAFAADELQEFIDDGVQRDDPVWSISSARGRRAATVWAGGSAGARGTAEHAVRAALLIVCALPGAVDLLYGDELALPEDATAPPALRTLVQPTGNADVLVPMPWEPDDPAARGAITTAAAQLEDAGSTLNLLRLALEIRRGRTDLPPDEIEWYGAPPHCFAFRGVGPGVTCVVNTGADAVGLPPGRPLLTSLPLEADLLPGRSAAWLVPVVG